MGILNLTPDSFSDGGRYLDPAAALDQALALEAAGADVLDMGAESTRPGHAPVSEDEELRRLVPVLERLAGRLRIPISVDTQKAVVARAAFERGVQILNDVAALTGRGMLDVACEGDFPIVVMHGVAQPLAADDAHPSESVAAWLDKRMEETGIARERFIVDPGIGFGTTRAQDAEILEHLEPLVALGRPLLVGLSRKRVVRALFPDEDVDRASVRMAHRAWRNGAAVLRLHNVRAFQAEME